ncbi:hypothetical protein [Streptomyces sp. BH055]|uniref:hypothetical protein n=1 Tax=Streptomyces sp. BH055 TaxID=3401173 RepID=UPI003BB66678
MKDQLTAAFRRLCLGTTLTLEAFGHWLSAEPHTPDRHTLRTDAPWLGRILLRTAITLGAAAFWGQLVSHAPYLIYAAPLAWVVTAWQMSDWSATPPPRGVATRNDIAADHARAVARGAQDPIGVMCIYHPPAEEETEDVNQR